jgi:hypothetical protein
MIGFQLDYPINLMFMSILALQATTTIMLNILSRFASRFKRCDTNAALVARQKQAEEDLKLNLKPIANQVGIKQIKNAQNGAILVECATEDDRDTIYFHMKDLDTTINVEEPRRREPRLVLHNVAPEIEENQQRFNCLLTKRNLIFSLSGK